MSEQIPLAEKDEGEQGDAASATVPPRLDVLSLRPDFSSPDHELYVSYIRDELNKPPKLKKPKRGQQAEPLSKLRPRNLALTGSYGSGKSSILSKIVEEFGDRVVTVSLSTLGSEEVNRPADDADKDPLETSPITNSIQKEIVKQLLYREKPRKVPGSRYKRIERFRHWRAIWLAAIIAGVLDVIVLLTGAFGRVERHFHHAFAPVAWSYVALFLLLTAAGWGIQLIFQNRLRVEKVTSGPASVSLTDTTESFFDKYLDELVYFFEANKYDIVIFEDLDRFNDPYIFETLRELNTLLNNSKQISPRVVTFVYAIKDSIFEQLGALSVNGVKLSPEEVRRLAVTNRTKFFDLVVPVVPFISHRNARDLLGNQMKQSGFVLAPGLIDRVSKYLVDMRLIKNVHNEYAIFKQKILGPGGVNELAEDQLFAMVVYKNLNMADFERIKDGDSALDSVYDDYRLLVNQQIAEADATIRQAQARLRKLNSVARRSKTLGDKLETYVTRIAEQSGSSLTATSLTLSTVVAVEDFRTAEFWTRWLENPELKLDLGIRRMVQRSGGWSPEMGTFTTQVSLTDVRAATADPIDADAWRTEDRQKLNETIADATKKRSALRRATLADVMSHSEWEVHTGTGSRSLDAAAAGYLGGGFALDLLRAGYIDRNFSLYVSLYYDDTVTAKARNYLLHTVEPNGVDFNADIGSTSEIEAMLVEAGGAVFKERSVYNLQIFDYLLDRADLRLDTSLDRLARGGADERAFIDAYFSAGSHLDKIVGRLAPRWTGVLVRVLEEESLSDTQRVALIDEALAAIPDSEYDTKPELGRFIEANFRQMAVLTGGRVARSAESIAEVLEASGVEFDMLADLADELEPFAIARSLYRLTTDNLVTALGGVTNLSLDSIRTTNTDVYRRVVRDIEAYLPIADGSSETASTIDDHKNFIPILNDLSAASAASIETVVNRAAPAFVLRVDALERPLWTVVAAAGRLRANYQNVRKYVEHIGGIDESLAVSLDAASAINELAGSEDVERRGLALALVNTPELSIDKRVQLASSLELEQSLDVADLSLNDEPDLAGALLRASLLTDSAETFVALASAGWPAQRSFMLASTNFESYLGDVAFTPQGLELLLQDALTPEAVKQAVLIDVETFAGALTGGSLRSLGRFGAERDAALPYAAIQRLAPSAVAQDTVHLVVQVLDELTRAELVSILSVMERDYRRMTETRGHTTISNTSDNVRLVDRLRAERVVSSRDEHPRGSTLRVNLFSKPTS